MTSRISRRGSSTLPGLLVVFARDLGAGKCCAGHGSLQSDIYSAGILGNRC
ncbi:hypothetical protein PF008_g6518 [Phytophthora fragariae]|uniref:Uncharacterized protein n=1 Tax=Phytophthora fragariae TaxID=53985 RepID=A0A6G0S6Z4_9STRA|nr:hypothetical protein PF008_g6518 [Phytophthora fragariae]